MTDIEKVSQTIDRFRKVSQTIDRTQKVCQTMTDPKRIPSMDVRFTILVIT